jgi:hypothetical protein
MEIVTNILNTALPTPFLLAFYLVFGYETVPINITYAIFLLNMFQYGGAVMYNPRPDIHFIIFSADA